MSRGTLEDRKHGHLAMVTNLLSTGLVSALA